MALVPCYYSALSVFHTRYVTACGENCLRVGFKCAVVCALYACTCVRVRACTDVHADTRPFDVTDFTERACVPGRRGSRENDTCAREMFASLAIAPRLTHARKRAAPQQRRCNVL